MIHTFCISGICKLSNVFLNQNRNWKKIEMTIVSKYYWSVIFPWINYHVKVEIALLLWLLKTAPVFHEIMGMWVQQTVPNCKLSFSDIWMGRREMVAQVNRIDVPCTAYVSTGWHFWPCWLCWTWWPCCLLLNLNVRDWSHLSVGVVFFFFFFPFYKLGTTVTGVEFRGTWYFLKLLEPLQGGCHRPRMRCARWNMQRVFQIPLSQIYDTKCVWGKNKEIRRTRAQLC